ncbi:MAG: Ferrochelatase [Elusimicrobia bacterium]|nr:Ferrochelatase [Elusimicrobiota bacterium]
MTKPMFNKKRAILFLNLGGPATQNDVRPFLFRLFEDPEIIRIPFTPLRKGVAWVLSLARDKESQAMYQKIGGGSPIRRLTENQAMRTENLLKKKGFDTIVQTAFTCSDPLVEDVVKDLSDQGVENFLSFPLYPQYSLTTTKGALNRTRAAVKRFSPQAKLIEICSWHLHPLFLQSHSELIRQSIATMPDPKEEHIHLVFSAHSIPEKLVTESGDPYQQQMEETVRGVLEALKWKGPWTLSWQSKLGPLKWIGPSTKETLIQLGAKGVKQILVVPIAFVTDHIETLYELDQELSQVASESGIQTYKRVPGLNSHPTFIEALADLALNQKEFWN